MSDEIGPGNRRVSSNLHPRVYALITGLAFWFVVSVWSFAVDANADYLLVVVSGFIVVAVALPCILSRVRRIDEGAEGESESSFRSWASADFATWQDRLPGANATVEILLPLAAVAFGMTAFGIIYHLVADGVV
jgi:hypothetical protein